MNLRRWFRGLEPKVLDMLHGSLWERMKPWMDRHDVLSFSRQPLAKGIAFGLFCGLIPGPLQVAGTLLLCAKWRGNFIAGAMATLYTNPLTIMPLYALAYQIGQLFLGQSGALPDFSQITAQSDSWLGGMVDWIQALGQPLLVGLPILGIGTAILGYAVVQFLWLRPVFKRLNRIKRRSAS